MKCWSLFILFLIGSSISAAEARVDDESDSTSSEMMLYRYVGNWEIEIDPGESPLLSGKTRAVWTLDHRFVEQTTVFNIINSAKPLEIKTLMTFDARLAKYRSWRFVSNGTVSESQGTWDSATKTLTFAGKEGDQTFVATSTFTSDGVEEWTIQVKDANAAVAMTLRGKSVRARQ